MDRDFVYVTGEVTNRTRVQLHFGKQASLADAIYDEAGGILLETGNVSEIYVLRSSSDPREFGAVTAWNLDAEDITGMVIAARMDLRPSDIIFVAEQSVTRWNRVVSQLVPSLFTSGPTALTTEPP